MKHLRCFWGKIPVDVSVAFSGRIVMYLKIEDKTKPRDAKIKSVEICA